MDILDLTLPLSNQSEPFPGDCPPRFFTENTLPQNGCQTQTWLLSSHQGTHIDAPAHVFSGGKCLSDYPLTTFSCPVQAVIRQAVLAPQMPLSHAGKEVSEDSERGGGILLLNTQWGKTAQKTGWDYFRDSPVLTPAFAEWIVAKGFSMVGMDFPGPDDWKDPLLPCHKILLAHDILLVENLTGLEQIPEKTTKKWQFNAFPLGVKGAEASPVRAFVTCLE